MKDIREEMKKLREEINKCDYWIEACNKDLKEMNFSSFSSYKGCKLSLKENEENKKRLEEKFDTLDRAYKILCGEEKDD